MNKCIIKIRTTILLLFLFLWLGNLSGFCQKIGYTYIDKANWFGSLIIDGEEYETIISYKEYEIMTSRVFMNKEKTFVCIHYAFPFPLKNNVFGAYFTFHLDQPIDFYVGNGKIKFESFRKDLSNKSYASFGFTRGYDELLRPNQFSAQIELDIKKGRDFHTYWFNAVEATASLEFTYKQGQIYDYSLDLNIKLIESKESDIDGKNLGNDLNATHSLQLKGKGELYIPREIKE